MDRTCSVDGCERPQKSRGWCLTHYMRWWSTGTVDQATDIRPTNQTLEQRFWAKVDKTETCWLWTGTLTKTGYGHFNHRRKWHSPHRLAWELVVGPIPDGMHIDHLCRVKKCVNPAHLEPVTNAENARRRAVAQTHCKRGHEFTPENTYLFPNSRRRGCRTCIRARDAGRSKRT